MREANWPDAVDYLDLDDAMVIVEDQGFSVRDGGLLGSALARPQASAFGEDAYPDLMTKTAALFESLVRNHALVDGNKRIAVLLNWTFLQMNGVRLVHSEDDAYDFTIAVAAGERTLEQIRDWFAAHIVPGAVA